MGELKDTAKKNSNFFKLEKGEEAIVTFLGFRIVPSTMDPTKDAAQFKLGTPYGEKYWTSSNSSIMMFFDSLKLNTLVKIKRDVWLNKDKSEDPSKSAWLVEEVRQEV